MSAPAMVPKLRRELSPRHLILFAISIVIGTRPIAEAAHAGPASVALWIMAAAGVLMPLAIATAVLTARHPGSGGLYRWTRNDFGPWHGFLCFWVYWFGTAFWFPGAAMLYASVAIYGLGPRYAHFADNRICVLAVSLLAIWVALGTNLVGFENRQWTENVGAGLRLASVRRIGRGCPVRLVSQRQRHAPSNSAEVELGYSQFWPNIAFGLTGIEMVGMMGEEITDPERNVPRAAMVAAAFGSIFYISMTLSLLVLSRPESISELYGLAQGGAAAGTMLGIPMLGPLVAVLIIGNAVGMFGSCGTAVSRLPLAAERTIFCRCICPHPFALGNPARFPFSCWEWSRHSLLSPSRQEIACEGLTTPWSR